MKILIGENLQAGRKLTDLMRLLADEQISLKPPLKWAGGKRWLVKHLYPLWQSHAQRRLVEPLCGGLAVAFGLSPDKALLNDINIHLINFFRQLGKGLVIELPMENDSELYYYYRDRFNRLLDRGRAESHEAAELFYYLNRTGYNGLCRFNKKGRFNVPFGRYEKINYQRDFTAYQKLFTNWQLESVDFEELPLKADDFIYADPPYDVPFTNYSAGGFTWADQVRLARRLADHPGPVLLSNQATDRVVGLYRELGYKLQFFEAPRLISCNGNRTPAREVLASRGV